MSEDLKDISDEPVDNRRVRRAIVLVERWQPIVDPVVGMARSWKTWAAAFALFAYLRGDDIIAAIVGAIQ